jgi:hypothetical protein
MYAMDFTVSFEALGFEFTNLITFKASYLVIFGLYQGLKCFESI